MLCVARRHVQRHGGKMDDEQSMFSGNSGQALTREKAVCILACLAQT